MKLIIKNASGQYWTGKCFGVRQAAEEYPAPNALPGQIIDNQGEDLEVTVHCIFPLDARYYYAFWSDGPDSRECQATVMMVKG